MVADLDWFGDLLGDILNLAIDLNVSPLHQVGAIRDQGCFQAKVIED